MHPVVPSSLSAWEGEHTCGLRTDNTITCWGVNYYGVTDAPAGHFRAVSAGSGHSCALRADEHHCLLGQQ